MNNMNDNAIDKIIKNALSEDIGYIDITTVSTVPYDREISAKLIAKESGVLCGIDMLKRIYHFLDDKVVIDNKLQDGTSLNSGDIIAYIEGNARNILIGERVALNFIQMLSGIATKTRQFVEIVKGTNAKICDTRKTAPGLRALQKYAVRVGGGHNHRFNLSDGILIKDNHIKAAGGITKAILAAREAAPHTLKIEVETENMSMVKEALETNADIIMLDNMSLLEIREAVAFVGGKALTEASGNMGDRDLREIAETGVDYISIGALTHSIKALDISMRFD